jgi:hypothetical protein
MLGRHGVFIGFVALVSAAGQARPEANRRIISLLIANA